VRSSVSALIMGSDCLREVVYVNRQLHTEMP
jgi:hypothetical protein